MDTAGNVYVADTRNHTIRKVTSAGVVSTLAGLPGSYGSADGTNGNARFCLPSSITVDLSGNLYVLDAGNQTVRMVAPSGANWVVTTIAGQADVAGSADGAGTDAQFCYPGGLGMNNSGSFSVADWGNNTIRAGVSSSNAAPGIVIGPQNQTVNQGQNAAFNVTAIGSSPLAYQWRFDGTNLAGATASSYTCHRRPVHQCRQLHGRDHQFPGRRHQFGGHAGGRCPAGDHHPAAKPDRHSGDRAPVHRCRLWHGAVHLSMAL